MDIQLNGYHTANEKVATIKLQPKQTVIIIIKNKKNNNTRQQQ